MALETQRQIARRRAREVRNVHAERRKEREKRIEDLAVEVLVALDMRTECERQAGRALTAMVDDEGLSIQNALEWCGFAISLRTATRLRAVADATSEENTDGATKHELDLSAEPSEAAIRDAAGRGPNGGADERSMSARSTSTGSARERIDARSTSGTGPHLDDDTSGGGGAR